METSNNTTPVYDVDYFINKFSAIPDELWCTGKLTIEQQHCALGFCGTTEDDRDSDHPDYYGGYVYSEEAKALVSLFENVWQLIDTNDCLTIYKLPTPKARVLAALADIKRSQQAIS